MRPNNVRMPLIWVQEIKSLPDYTNSFRSNPSQSIAVPLNS